MSRKKKSVSSAPKKKIVFPPVFTSRALFLLACTIIFLRAPFLFFEPRLYAEEGAVYLVHAWQSSFWEALCYIFSGYFSLIANLAAALAARVFSVEAIPRVTLVLAFFVQALPHYILFFRYSQRFTQMQKI